MLSEIKNFVKGHFHDIMLFIIISLLILLAFGAGYITAKYRSKEPIKIYNNGK